ncbi:MAG TPA: cytochrome c oxidase subunit II [Casimicrobiaceae bacterium]|nr:cytochrome c oxidase subunit II [Casimicrobiaceae bacterium]
MGDLAKGLALVSLALPGVAIANGEAKFGFQTPQTIIAHQIYDLHAVILGVCIVIAVVVFGFMFYAIVRHRRSVGHEAKQFQGNIPLEILWTVIPCLIVAGMAYPATKTVIAMKDTSTPDITVKVTGYQWKWRYDYLGENVSFYSDLSTPREQIENQAPKGDNYLLEVDNPLVVPVGKKIRILVTADDVIHSWWVPAFGVKQDGIPGFVRDSWFKVDTPGVYRGQCAELCGKEHGFMPIVVEALPEEQYRTWLVAQRTKGAVAAAAASTLAGKTYTLDELKTEGEKVYGRNCAACHQASGQGVPGAFPAIAHGVITTGPVAGHIDIVLNGSKKNPAMTAWKSQLSDLELAAVITFERNAFGNSLGDMVQPKDILAARK